MKKSKYLDPNSMLIWWPKVKGLLRVPTPKTEIVSVPFKTLVDFYEGKPGVLKKYIPEIEAKAKAIGFPMFLRTDLSSAKHYWNRTCYVPTKEDFFSHLREIMDFNLCCDMMGLTPCAIVMREFLELDWKFKAFMGEMPVSPEIRVFVKDGKFQCQHAYWIEEAIEQGGTKQKGWKRMLKDMNDFRSHEIYHVVDMAKLIAKRLDGYWSLDFARTRQGVWVFIDAAVGGRSWHPECGYNPAPKPDPKPSKSVDEAFKALVKKMLPSPKKSERMDSVGAAKKHGLGDLVVKMKPGEIPINDKDLPARRKK